MDGSRFDALTRALARDRTRRGVLRGILGGVAAGVAALTGREDAVAQRLPHGSACTRATQCASLRCVDGACCNSQCAGQCESCATGVCEPVTGASVGNRPACPGSGDCRGTCDGVTRDRCAAFPGAATGCGTPTCANGWLTTYGCGGNGSCHPTTSSCDPYLCAADGAACLSSCVSNGDCAGAASCVDGACLEDRPLGEPCTADAQCQSGVCAQGVCCAGACPGGCHSCNVPGNEGFCVEIPDGGPCDGGTCCDGACVDTQTSLEHCGTCDHACRLDPAVENCEGDPICRAGTCGFASAPPGTVCRAARCDGGIAILEAICPGNGAACPPVQTQPCAPLVCGATACRPSCTSDDHCIASHHCDDGQCLPDEGLGADCNEDSDCATAICNPVNHVCCTEVCDSGVACSGPGSTCCVPDCAGKTCGDDGCGDSCGSCEGSLECDAFGRCIASCGGEEEPCCDGAVCDGALVCDVRRACVASCGGTAELCCDGFVCDGDIECSLLLRCEPCGAMDQICCRGGTCDGDLGCVDDVCAPCGAAGEGCCDGVCDGALVCSSDNECVTSCGGLGEACCAGGGCDGGIECVNDVCQPCGGADQVCCPPGRTCDGDLECTLFGVCGACGGLGETCCPNLVCDGGVPCSNRLRCEPCGAADQVCCIGADCDADGTCCNGMCLNTQTDPTNCGACGNACAPGERCEGGACGCASASCAGTCCNGTCVDTQSDERNCGGCGVRCRVNETCTNGQCLCGTEAGVCPPGFVCGICPHAPGGFACFSCSSNVGGAFCFADPNSCLGVGFCPPGTTPCVGTVPHCLFETTCQSCCPSGSTCDTVNGTCLQ